MRLPSLSRVRALVPLFCLLSAPLGLHSQSVGGRVVLVLPFENRSGNPSLSWIGDSFPDTLDKRLESAHFLTISRDDRAFAFDHLGLPQDFRPSRASTIRIAQRVDANYVIVGSFTVVNNQIQIQARVLSVDALTLSPTLEDGAELTRLFDAENAIAWKVARQIDPHFNVTEQTFLSGGGSVPLAAFEDYIRGSNAATPAESLQRLQAAANLAPAYADDLLALGKVQYEQRDYASAAATLARVPSSSRLALEANFYLGLSRFNAANYAGAEQAFATLAQQLSLPEVVNDEAVARSRQNKDAVALFQQASLADPSDEDYHYNLAIALFRRGDVAAALREADAALKLKPNDNEAGSLRARLSLAAPGTKLASLPSSGFSPVERIRRDYSETGFRQAAFQLDQLRAAQLALLPPQQRAQQYVQLGYDYLNQNLLPEAESEFQSALEANPSSATAHLGLAQLRDRAGDPTAARAEALASLQLEPSANAFLVLARLDLADAMLSAAASDVAHALQLEPQNAAAQAMKTTLQQRGQQVQ
jgi:tetratricopeptide (TPR) repeat protein